MKITKYSDASDIEKWLKSQKEFEKLTAKKKSDILYLVPMLLSINKKLKEEYVFTGAFIDKVIKEDYQGLEAYAQKNSTRVKYVDIFKRYMKAIK